MVSYYGLLTSFFRNQENLTVTASVFLFEISLRREEIRVSGVVRVVSGMGLLLLILQALGCVGDV